MRTSAIANARIKGKLTRAKPSKVRDLSDEGMNLVNALSLRHQMILPIVP
ncbi:hypothetical protein GCM10009092_41130 [Bowmanella denitrificans]|uniref:Uncharacterized protein n=1 Tax=Bowmanella denitrificans TaxID=366582 RepID=A0ABN0XTT6_9ALTE